MPTDTGWAWVVMAAAMFSTLLEMGTFKTFGIFFVAFLEKFEASATTTSLVSSVFSIAYSVFAFPVMTCVIEKFSCRQVVMFGGCSICIGYILSSLATNVGFLIFAQGIVAALGSACIHGPSVVILNRYFDKRRGFAIGMAISCGSLGSIIFPIVFTAMLQKYSLNGALLIQSAILFNCTAAGAFFRPLSLTNKMAEFKKWKSRKNVKTKNENAGDDSSCMLPSKDKLSNDTGEDETTKFNFARTECTTVFHDDKLNRAPMTNSEEFNGVQKNLKCLRKSRDVLELPNRPGITQFSSSYDSFGSMLGTLREIGSKNVNSVKDKKEVQCMNCNSPALSKYVDFSVCKVKIVMLFAFVFSFGNVTCVLPATFIPPYARQKHMSENDIAILAATIGGSEFIGRICCGLFADLNLVKRYKIVMFGLFCAGLMVQFTQYLDDFWHFELFCVLFGVFGGFLVTLYSPVCIDFIGLEKFHKAIGILMTSQGMVAGIAGIVIGMLRDVSGDYIVGFHVMGGCGLFAAGLLLLVPLLTESDDDDDESTSEEKEHMSTGNV